MKKSLETIIEGYQSFRAKYASGDQSFKKLLSQYSQKPQTMVIACCDSHVDPTLIFQCDPGELLVVRNVANIVPPYENDLRHHGTSAALEFGVRFLKVKHLILLGHSQCAGISNLISDDRDNDFISTWVSLIENKHSMPNNNLTPEAIDDYTKFALHRSYYNCLTFPWIGESVQNNELTIHRWFFDMRTGQIIVYDVEQQCFVPLDTYY